MSRIDHERDALIAKHARSGISAAKIARMLDLSECRVFELIKRIGVMDEYRAVRAQMAEAAKAQRRAPPAKPGAAKLRELTKMRRAVWAVEAMKALHGHWLTVREFADHMGITNHCVCRNDLREMHQNGLLVMRMRPRQRTEVESGAAAREYTLAPHWSGQHAVRVVEAPVVWPDASNECRPWAAAVAGGRSA